MASSAGEQVGLDFSDGHLSPEELNRQLRLKKAAAQKLKAPVSNTSASEEIAALKEENAALKEEIVALKKENAALKAHAPAPAASSPLEEGEKREAAAEAARVEAEARAKAEARVQAEAEAEAEAKLLAADPLSKYKRSYSEAQIAANRAKVAPEGTGEAMYAAAEKGEEAKLLKLVEPWFAHPVLNDYSGYAGGWTPLITASRNGRIECVRVLVAQPGIELNKGFRDYESTALYCASAFGHVDIVELLWSVPRHRL